MRLCTAQEVQDWLGTGELTGEEAKTMEAACDRASKAVNIALNWDAPTASVPKAVTDAVLCLAGFSFLDAKREAARAVSSESVDETTAHHELPPYMYHAMQEHRRGE